MGIVKKERGQGGARGKDFEIIRFYNSKRYI